MFNRWVCVNNNFAYKKKTKQKISRFISKVSRQLDVEPAEKWYAISCFTLQSQSSNLIFFNFEKFKFQTQTSKEVKQVQEDKQKMTEHFIQTLPILLQRYGADAEKLANLMAIPQFFDLVVYTNSRQEAVSIFNWFKFVRIKNDKKIIPQCLEFASVFGQNGQHNVNAQWSRCVGNMFENIGILVYRRQRHIHKMRHRPFKYHWSVCESV